MISQLILTRLLVTRLTVAVPMKSDFIDRIDAATSSRRIG